MTWLVLLALSSGAGDVERLVVADSPEQVMSERTAAVDRVIATLPRIVRPFARPLLHKATWGCGEMSVERGSETVTIGCDDKEPLVVPLDGTVVDATGPSGRPFQARATVAGGLISVRMENELGARISSMEWVGDAVVCRRRVESSRLRVPLEWEMRYRPKEP